MSTARWDDVPVIAVEPRERADGAAFLLSHDDGLRRHLARVDLVLAGVADELATEWAAANGPGADTVVDQNFPAMFLRLVRGGGKRLRPTMSYLGWRAAGGRLQDPGYDDVVRVSAALDLLHGFALAHDDIMDASEFRRGRPTAHVVAADLHRATAGVGDSRRFGESIAILLGDLVHAEASHLVAGLPASMRSLWRALVLELVAGQLRDLTGTAAGRRDLEYARRIARAKSGAYSVERPLQLGCLAAGGSEAAWAALSEYGRNVGEAFALSDDLLGVFGDPDVTGKPAGGDLLSGKATVLLSIAADRLRGSAAELLRRVGTEHLTESDVDALQQEFRRRGVLTAVESMITARVDAAVAALDPDVLEPDAVTELVASAHRVAWRTR